MKSLLVVSFVDFGTIEPSLSILHKLYVDGNHVTAVRTLVAPTKMEYNMLCMQFLETALLYELLIYSLHDLLKEH